MKTDFNFEFTLICLHYLKVAKPTKPKQRHEAQSWKVLIFKEDSC